VWKIIHFITSQWEVLSMRIWTADFVNKTINCEREEKRKEEKRTKGKERKEKAQEDDKL
jgi:hypothetical protein